MGLNKNISTELVFIDTNTFVENFVGEIEDADITILNEILDKINSEELTLILPENIFHEIENEINNVIKNYTEGIESFFDDEEYLRRKIKITDKKFPIPKIIQENIEKNKEKTIKEFKKECKSSKKILDKIIKNKKVISVKLTDDIILSAIRRSTLEKAPFTNKKGKHVVHQDCIAFESILSHLNKKHSFTKIIICSQDGDYFKGSKNKKTEDLHKNIIDSLKIDSAGYRNAKKMLKEEFEIDYTEDEIEKYEDYSEKHATTTTTFPPSGLQSEVKWANVKSFFNENLAHYDDSVKNFATTSTEQLSECIKCCKILPIRHLSINRLCQECQNRRDNYMPHQI